LEVNGEYEATVP